MKHFWVCFSMEKAEPWFQLSTLQESFQLPNQTAESQVHEVAPWSRFVGAATSAAGAELLGVGSQLSAGTNNKSWYR